MAMCPLPATSVAVPRNTAQMNIHWASSSGHDNELSRTYRQNTCSNATSAER